MSLQSEDQFQVPAFITVVQEPIITDLLESTRKYMHQVTADKFHMADSDPPPRFAGFAPPGRKSDLRICNGKNPAV